MNGSDRRKIKRSLSMKKVKILLDARGNAVEDLESVMEAYRLAEVIARACKR